jgi:hypothetical protein
LIQIEPVVNTALFKLIGDQGVRRKIASRSGLVLAGRQAVVGTLEIMQGQTDLFQMVDALRPPSRLAGGLHRGQQQRDQHTDNRNHDQQLDQRKASRPSTTPALISRAHQHLPVSLDHEKPCAVAQFPLL